MGLHSPQIIVIGDEVESVLTAVSAARAGASVTLVRRSSHPWLGGLSTRGGLSYMDITPAYKGPLFQEFLEKAGVVRVALDPHRAHQTLQKLLEDAGIPVMSGVIAKPFMDGNRLTGLHLSSGEIFKPEIMIDCTPDADLARQLGVPYIKGLGGLLDKQHQFLGVSPVFRITGIKPQDFQTFETKLRTHAQVKDMIHQALPYHPESLKDAYVDRPTYLGEEGDYLDVLNPAIGIFYHVWRHGSPASYAAANTWIDGANMSLLPDGSMGFNGLVHRIDDFDTLIALSHGGNIPPVLLDEMKQFERFLQEEGKFTQAKVIPPDELYVRQTVTLQAKQNMSAAQAIRGGVRAEESIGTFSYWLDMRGVVLNQFYPGTELPKPVFNVGLEVAFSKNPNLSNLAFVSRSAGYSPLGQGTGRIVQHNSLLGEGIGIAAAIAIQRKFPISKVPIQLVKYVLDQRQGFVIPLSGHPTWTETEIAQSALLMQDEEILQNLEVNV